MPAGRPPKATFLHVVQNTYRKHRHAKRLDREPRPVGDLGGPPEWLSEGQRAVWDRVLQHAPPGLLKAVDWSSVMAFCVATDIHRMATEELNKLGPDGLVGPSEQLARALVGIASRQAVIMLKHAAELGFSPVSRTRVTVDPRKEVNPFDEFA